MSKMNARTRKETPWIDARKSPSRPPTPACFQDPQDTLSSVVARYLLWIQRASNNTACCDDSTFASSGPQTLTSSNPASFNKDSNCARVRSNAAYEVIIAISATTEDKDGFVSGTRTSLMSNNESGAIASRTRARIRRACLSGQSCRTVRK